MPSWSSLKQKGGSQGRGSQGGKVLYAFPPSSSLHLKDFKAPNILLTAFWSQRPHLRGYFSYTFIRNALLQTAQERGLTWLPWSDPGRIPPPSSDKRKPPKTPWVTQPQSQRLPSSESTPIIESDQLYWREKNLPWIYLQRQTEGYLHKIAGKGTLQGLFSCGKGFIYYALTRQDLVYS